MPVKIAILASGRGSNARTIINAVAQGKIDADIKCLICNVKDAPVLSIGEDAGLPSFMISHRSLSREEHESKILDILNRFDVDYLVLAGYMRLLTPAFLNVFKGDNHYRIVNIHPSILPAFPGATAYEDAYNYGVKISGVTVHFLDETMDGGPVLMQETFTRFDDDTLEDFKRRGVELEHQLYPRALQLIAENRLFFRYDKTTRRSYIEVKLHASC